MVEGKFWYSSNLFVADKVQAILKSFDMRRFSEKKSAMLHISCLTCPKLVTNQQNWGVWEYTLNGP